MNLILLLLACTPALRIPPPVVAPAPRSEVPEAARVAYLHAAVIREQGDPERALLALSRARALDPDDPWLALEAARLQLAQGRLAEADLTLRSLIPGPAEVDALALRGVAARLRGEPVAAEVLLTEAMTRAPEREELWRERMGLLLAVGGRDAEVQALARSWADGPARSAVALQERGRARLLAGDAVGAVDDLGAAVVLGERTFSPTLLTVAARESGRLGSALGWLERVELDEPDLLKARLRLARLAGDLIRERACLEALLVLEPRDGERLAELAGLLALQGEARAAKQARARAAALGVKVAPAVVRGAPDVSGLLAEAAARLQALRPEEALPIALEAVDRAPASEAAWRTLARVFTTQARFADAALADGRAARYAAARSPNP